MEVIKYYFGKICYIFDVSCRSIFVSLPFIISSELGLMINILAGIRTKFCPQCSRLSLYIVNIPAEGACYFEEMVLLEFYKDVHVLNGEKSFI